MYNIFEYIGDKTWGYDKMDLNFVTDQIKVLFLITIYKIMQFVVVKPGVLLKKIF